MTVDARRLTDWDCMVATKLESKELPKYEYILNSFKMIISIHSASISDVNIAF